MGEMTAAVVLRRGLQALKDGSGFARLTRGVGEPIRAERASDSLKPSGAHLATKARYAPIGDRAGIGRASRGSRTASNVSSGGEPITGSGASVMRCYWALRLGREAPPCILSRGRKGASGEPVVSQNGWAARSRTG